MNVRSSIFEDGTGEKIWLEGHSSHADSNILITVTSPTGERSAYISGGSVTQLQAGQLVDPAPEVQSEQSARKYSGAKRAVTISGYVFAVLLMSFSVLSFSGVAKARIVLTGSMKPAINPGDIIITTPISHKSPKVGDVIAYQARRFSGQAIGVFSHRIIGGDLQSGFVVKGDANKTPDNQKPVAKDILGVVLFTIPFLGNILTPKALFLLVPCIFGLWLILDAMKNVE
jgi:signal peptidase I